ncbi:MAG: SufD family Fe-S cluster assembly protein [Bacilli bacterium]|nr:SufD family Fe-S cluster assembly protein [Bacilli bacterium]
MELTYVNEQIQDLSLVVKEGETTQLNFASFSQFPQAKIDIRVASNGHLDVAFADFSEGKGKLSVAIYLEGEGASCNWHLSSLTRGDSQKVFDISLSHVVPHTEGAVSNYGITLGQSRLSFQGISKIANGAKGAKTRQAAKIIVFDPESRGECSPILAIDENDVAASHAAVVGKLNDEHLFYLESRGLPPKEAKRLITLGYLKPVLAYFTDEALKKRIEEAIEGGIQ